MKFEDLTDWDLNLIRSNAISLISNSRAYCRFKTLFECTMSCIYSKGFKLNEVPKDLDKLFSQSVAPHGSSRNDLMATAVIREIFKFLKAQNLEIINDPDRVGTWDQPNASWYHKNPIHKKPWVF